MAFPALKEKAKTLIMNRNSTKSKKAYSHSSHSRNPDPLTGEAGAHPLGTCIGAVTGGMATGAAVGTVAGPAGAIAGAIVGAISGGLTGHSVAERINPSVIQGFWRAKNAQPRRPVHFDDFRHA